MSNLKKKRGKQMKKLKLFLCLMTMAVGLSTTQLQTNAAAEKTGLEVVKPAGVEESQAAKKESTVQNSEIKKDVKIVDKQITTQNTGATTSSVYLYPNATYVFNESGLLHVYTNSKEAYVYLVNNANASQYADYAKAESGSGYHVTFPVGKGTYKLAISDYDYYGGVRFTAKKEIPTFSPSKSMKITRNDNLYFSGSYYIKVKAKKNGLLTVTPNSKSMKVRLLNGNKKALSDDSYYYVKESACYGIKKGATYYLKISGYDQLKYTLKFNVINEKSGSKKSKAYKLSKKNKWSYGTLLAGSGQADWYKIYLTKKSKLGIVIKPQTTAGLKISVYGPDGKQFGSTASLSKSYNGKQCPFNLYYKSWFKTDYNLKKGTYYVKIVRAAKNSSGSYAIKWNTKTYK